MRGDGYIVERATKRQARRERREDIRLASDAHVRRPNGAAAVRRIIICFQLLQLRESGQRTRVGQTYKLNNVSAQCAASACRFRCAIHRTGSQKCAIEACKFISLSQTNRIASGVKFLVSHSANPCLQRRIKQTLSETIYPIYIIGIMVLVKFLTTSTTVHPPLLQPPALPLVPQFAHNASDALPAFRNATLAYTPATDAHRHLMEATLSALQHSAERVGRYDVASLRLEAANSSDALHALYLRSSPAEFFAGVELHTRNASQALGGVDSRTRAVLRFNASAVPSSDGSVAAIAPALQCRTAASDCRAEAYVDSGFLALQLALQAAAAGVVPSPKLSSIAAQPFPMPRYVESIDNGFFRAALGLYFVIAFTPVVQYLAVNVVGEKVTFLF